MRGVPSGVWWMWLVACAGAGEMGDACFSDFDCESSSCSAGSCDSSLVAALRILGELAEDAPQRPPPPAEPVLSRELACANRSEAECSRLAHCHVVVTCVPPPECLTFSSSATELAQCLECYSAASCPAPCTRLTRCQ